MHPLKLSRNQSGIVLILRGRWDGARMSQQSDAEGLDQQHRDCTLCGALCGTMSLAIMYGVFFHSLFLPRCELDVIIFPVN